MLYVAQAIQLLKRIIEFLIFNYLERTSKMLKFKFRPEFIYFTFIQLIKIQLLHTRNYITYPVSNCSSGCECTRRGINDTDNEFKVLTFYCNSVKNIVEEKNIERIEIEGNISSIPSNILLNDCYYKDVKFLSIANTNITIFHSSDFNCFTNLYMLDLSSNQIKNITNFFTNLFDLRILLLGRNKIDRIGKDSFVYLRKLLDLVLSTNTISEISEDTYFPKTIRSIDFSYNRIKSKLIVYFNNNFNYRSQDFIIL